LVRPDPAGGLDDEAITLIGFIGSDAERKAANATNIAIFSLATNTSLEE
jgi:hypothetical protein